MKIDPSLVITERGPIVGSHRGRDIHAWMKQNDKYYDYDRVAHTDRDGGTPLSQLRADEFVVAPGLIYRLRASQSPGATQ